MKKFSLLALAIFAASCTSRVATEEKKSAITTASTYEDRKTADAVLNFLNDESRASCSLSAQGTITLKDGDASQSGHFELKSKRLQSPQEPRRVDSLSMIVTGPFGITGAKFLGSPEEYQFYNAIEGEKYRGKPDPKTLQEITGMSGLTLELLSDVIYGLAPSASQILPGDSVVVTSASEYRHTLHIRRASGALEAIILNGKLPQTSADKTKLTIIQYERWNTIPALASTAPKADITINYQGLYDYKDFPLPNFITARSASTELEIEYTSAEENPKDLTVKIKMPK